MSGLLRIASKLLTVGTHNAIDAALDSSGGVSC